MNEQPSLFDVVTFDRAEGERRKLDGIAAVDTAKDDDDAVAYAEWQRNFDYAATRLSLTGKPFTFEELWADPNCGIPPGDPNRRGANVRRMVMQLGLVMVGYRKSAQPSRHAGRVVLWQRR